jgi:hypothetical protein
LRGELLGKGGSGGGGGGGSWGGSLLRKKGGEGWLRGWYKSCPPLAVFYP